MRLINRPVVAFFLVLIGTAAGIGASLNYIAARIMSSRGPMAGVHRPRLYWSADGCSGVTCDEHSMSLQFKYFDGGQEAIPVLCDELATATMPAPDICVVTLRRGADGH